MTTQTITPHQKPPHPKESQEFYRNPSDAQDHQEEEAHQMATPMMGHGIEP
jgi:hypothetical protein